MNERAVFKCRGIREDTGEWVTGYAIPDEITGQMFILPSSRVGEEGCLRFWAYEIVPESLCYFTGMTDKKGTQIYEKDIVKNSKGQIGEIVWIPSFCGFFIKCREGTESLDDSVIDIEVIGNTVTSPGLLERTEYIGQTD